MSPSQALGITFLPDSICHAVTTGQVLPPHQGGVLSNQGQEELALLETNLSSDLPVPPCPAQLQSAHTLPQDAGRDPPSPSSTIRPNHPRQPLFKLTHPSREATLLCGSSTLYLFTDKPQSRQVCARMRTHAPSHTHACVRFTETLDKAVMFDGRLLRSLLLLQSPERQLCFFVYGHAKAISLLEK